MIFTGFTTYTISLKVLLVEIIIHHHPLLKKQLIARRVYCVGESPKMMCFCSHDVCTCVPSKRDQVWDGKTSLSKVSGSKRDPKKEHVPDLIACFWDVDEISRNRSNWKIIWSNDVFRPFGRDALHVLISSVIYTKRHRVRMQPYRGVSNWQRNMHNGQWPNMHYAVFLATQFRNPVNLKM